MTAERRHPNVLAERNADWARHRATLSLALAVSAWGIAATPLVLRLWGGWTILGGMGGLLAAGLAIWHASDARKFYRMSQGRVLPRGSVRAAAALAVAWSFVLVALLSPLWVPVLTAIWFALESG